MKLNNWILTDDDSQQYVRHEHDFVFSLIEMGLVNPDTGEHEVYTDTIDVDDYLETMREELTNILNSFGYDSIEDVEAKYYDSPQVMAECIFEYYGSFKADVKFTGTENECTKYIQEYVCS